jgi:hypothetical protein
MSARKNLSKYVIDAMAGEPPETPPSQCTESDGYEFARGVYKFRKQLEIRAMIVENVGVLFFGLFMVVAVLLEGTWFQWLGRIFGWVAFLGLANWLGISVMSFAKWMRRF